LRNVKIKTHVFCSWKNGEIKMMKGQKEKMNKSFFCGGE
jgi:hypothetical protein